MELTSIYYYLFSYSVVVVVIIIVVVVVVGRAGNVWISLSDKLRRH